MPASCGIGSRTSKALPRPAAAVAGPADQIPAAEQVVKRGALVLDSTICFQQDSDRLENKDKVELEKVVSMLKKHADLIVEIKGHTDTTGSDRYNINLSARRARMILKYLYGEAVDPSQLRIHWYGESMPATDNTSARQRRLNRRVELQFSEILVE